MDSFYCGREMTRPRIASESINDMGIEQIRALPLTLTEEEKRSPFAKYYYEPMAELQDAHKKAFNEPLPPSLCYMPYASIPIMMADDQVYPRCGYGVLENGVGYVSSYIEQDGITDEMIYNYRENFAPLSNSPATLFYKTWYPGKHLIHFGDAIVEDFGWGLQVQIMDWEILNLEKHLNIRREDILKKDPDCIAILGVGGFCSDLFHPDESEHTFMVQYLRDTGHGRILWIHYWVGIKLDADGSVTICPRADSDTMLYHAKCMMTHAMKESCNEIKHIKEFWQEKGGLQ